jgi:hypothetical protein
MMYNKIKLQIRMVMYPIKVHVYRQVDSSK